MNTTLAKKICEKAKEIGYDKCGIIKIEDINGFENQLNKRIKLFPESKEDLNKLKHYAHPEKEFPWAKSIIICAYSINKFEIPEHLNGKIGKYYLVDGRRNCESEQYQIQKEFQKYLDEIGIKALIGEDHDLTTMRWTACKAGIGIIRKNNFFYTEDGSYIVLKSWLIDKELEYKFKSNLEPCPESCSLCIEMCPTSSLLKDYATNKMTCISGITCNHENNLMDEPLREQLGEWICGCDICQDVCPFNQWEGHAKFPNLEDFGKKVSLSKIVEMDYSKLQSIVQNKLWYIPEDKLWKFKVNALNSMLNNWQKKYESSVEISIKDSNENVKKMGKFVKSIIDY